MSFKGKFFAQALLGATALSVLAVATDAQAAGFAIREQSTTSQGVSFAGAAAGGNGSISGMFWNPAVITQNPGWISENHAAGIIPQSDVDIDPVASSGPGGAPLAAFAGGVGDTSSDIGQAAIVPSSYSSYQVNDMLFLGLGMNSPFGLVTDPDNGWAGRFHALTSDVLTFNINPVMALKLNDMLSVAAGVQVNYINARLRSATPLAAVPPPVPEGNVRVKGTDWGAGVTAGLTLKPYEGTTLGVGYRSRIKHELDGNARIDTGAGVVSLGGITGKITLPDTVTIGLRQEITPDWAVLAGFEWANWSQFKNLTINTDAGGVLSTTPENWDDSYFFSLGVEHRWNEQLTVRAGVAYEDSPVPDSFRTPRIPDADRFWLSAGASYQYNDWLSFDLAYTHIFVDDAPINLSLADNPTRGALVGDADGSVDIIGVAVRFNWGGDSAPKLFGK